MITFHARSVKYPQLQPYVLAALHEGHDAMMETVESLSIAQATKILKIAIEGIVLQRCYKQDNPYPANVT